MHEGSQADVNTAYQDALDFFTNQEIFSVGILQKLQNIPLDKLRPQDQTLLIEIHKKTAVFAENKNPSFIDLLAYITFILNVQKTAADIYPNAGTEIYLALLDYLSNSLDEQPKSWFAYTLDYATYRNEPAHEKQKMALLSALEKADIETSSEAERNEYQALISKSRGMKQAADIHDYIAMAKAIKKIEKEAVEEELVVWFEKVSAMAQLINTNFEFNFKNLCQFFYFMDDLKKTGNLIYVGAGTEWSAVLIHKIKTRFTRETQPELIAYAQAYVQLILQSALVKEFSSGAAKPYLAVCAEFEKFYPDQHLLEKTSFECVTQAARQTHNLYVKNSFVTMEDVASYQKLCATMDSFNVSLAEKMRCFIAPLALTAQRAEEKKQIEQRASHKRQGKNLKHTNATVDSIAKKIYGTEKNLDPQQLLIELGWEKIESNDVNREFLDYLQIPEQSVTTNTVPWVQNRGTNDTYIDETYYPADGKYEELKAAEYQSVYVVGLAHAINDYLANAEKGNFKAEFTRFFNTQADYLFVIERRIRYESKKHNYAAQKINYEVVYVYTPFKNGSPRYAGIFIAKEHVQHFKDFISDLMQAKRSSGSPKFADSLPLSSPTLGNVSLPASSNQRNSGSLSPSLTSKVLSQAKTAEERRRARENYKQALALLRERADLQPLSIALGLIVQGGLIVASLELLTKVIDASLNYKKEDEASVLMLTNCANEVEATQLFPEVVAALKAMQLGVVTQDSFDKAYNDAFNLRETYPILKPVLHAIGQSEKELSEQNKLLLTQLLNQGTTLLKKLPENISQADIASYTSLLDRAKNDLKNSTLVKALYGVFAFITLTCFIFALIFTFTTPPIAATVGAATVASYFFEGGVIAAIATLALRSHANRWLPLFDATLEIKNSAQSSVDAARLTP